MFHFEAEIFTSSRTIRLTHFVFYDFLFGFLCGSFIAANLFSLSDVFCLLVWRGQHTMAFFNLVKLRCLVAALTSPSVFCTRASKTYLLEEPAFGI